ncbi:hypothetical protein [Angustibacter aerolatus]
MHPPRTLVPARDVDELLDLLGAASLDALSDRVGDYLEVDAWVPDADEQGLLPHALRVMVRRRHVVLEFPFSPAELVEAVLHAERKARRDVELEWADEAAARP